MPREDDEFEVETMSTRMAKHTTSSRAYLNAVEGLSRFVPRKTDPMTLAFITYRVTDAILQYPEVMRYARPGKLYYERTFKVHRHVGVNDESHVCLAQTFGEPCPICEDVIRLRKTGQKLDMERVEALKTSDRQLFLVYDFDAPSKGLQLWDESHFNFGAQLDAYVRAARPQDRDAYSQFYHPTKGFDVRVMGSIRKMPRGENTIFGVHQFYPRDGSIPRSLFDHTYDLDAMIRHLSYADLKGIYSGRVEDEDRPRRDDSPTSGTADRGLDDPRRAAPPRDERRVERVERNGADERSAAPPADDRYAERARRDTDPDVRNAQAADDRRADPPVQRQAPPRPEPKPKPEPKPAAAGWTPAADDLVRFEYRGEKVTGRVERVDADRQLAFVPLKGRDKPLTLAFDELELVESAHGALSAPADPEPPPPPAPKEKNLAAAGKKSKWDDEQDDRTYSGR